MKKIFIIFLLTIALFGISGCTNNKKSKTNHDDLSTVLNDDIKAKVNLVKDGKSKIIRIKFDKKPENTKYKIKLIYYKNKKNIYQENLIYAFPSEDVECIMELPIKKYQLVIKNSSKRIQTEEYNNKNTTKVKLEYDKLKLIISK